MWISGTADGRPLPTSSTENGPAASTSTVRASVPLTQAAPGTSNVPLPPPVRGPTVEALTQPAGAGDPGPARTTLASVENVATDWSEPSSASQLSGTEPPTTTDDAGGVPVSVSRTARAGPTVSASAERTTVPRASRAVSVRVTEPVPDGTNVSESRPSAPNSPLSSEASSVEAFHQYRPGRSPPVIVEETERFAPTVAFGVSRSSGVAARGATTV